MQPSAPNPSPFTTSAEKWPPLAHVLWLFWLIPILLFGYAVYSISDWEIASDWLEREGHHLVTWWLLTTAAGIAVFPLFFRLLPALSDRGYTIARAGGLMLTGFVFWFMVSLGLMQNTVGGMVLAWVIVVFISLLAWLRWDERPTAEEIKRWLVEHFPLIIITEVLFIVAFVAWAYVRAHNPEIVTTEKPMEMNFINGIRNSTTFPPKDPWLAGYSISYYYFGYVITAMLADLSGINTGTAFSLILALLFALASIGALGVTYNLVRAAGNLRRWRVGNRNMAIGAGLLAATFLVLMGNLGTALIEAPFRGYTVDTVFEDAIDEDYFEFWDVKERVPEASEDPEELAVWEEKSEIDETGWEPGWWWWRQSRLIHDKNLAGDDIEAITEFPHFSFIIGDNHPHVLSLPFVMLTLGLIAGLALRQRKLAIWEIGFYAILVGGMVFMNSWDLAFVVLAVGAEALRRLLKNGNGRLSGWSNLGQIFMWEHRRELNTWLAGPVFIVLLVILLATDVFNSDGIPIIILYVLLAVVLTLPITLLTNWALDDHDWGGVIRFGVLLGGLTFLLYYPWIDSFTSQADGILPNIVNATPTQQFFLQFGVYILIILAFLLQQILRAGRRINWFWVLFTGFWGLIFVLAVPLISGIALNNSCPTQAQPNVSTNQAIYQFTPEESIEACERRRDVFGQLEDPNAIKTISILGVEREFTGFEAELYEIFERRMDGILAEMFLILGAAIVLMRLFARPPQQPTQNPEVANYSPGTGVALLFMGAGLVLALIPDILYLKDNFGWRMNTIFKLYYQGWALFSVSGAFAVYALLFGVPRSVNEPRASLSEPSTILRLSASGAFGLIFAVFFAAGMLFPYFAIPTRANYELGLTPDRPAAIERCEEAEGQNCERPLSLDAEPTMTRAITRAEYEVIQCFAELESPKTDVTIAEAQGDSYRAYTSRVSMMTGVPTILGWVGHQGQWRGATISEVLQLGDYERGSLLQLMYSEPVWSVKAQYIASLGVDYVMVGQHERSVYGSEFQRKADEANVSFSREEYSELGFAGALEPVCEAGTPGFDNYSAIYRVTPY